MSDSDALIERVTRIEIAVAHLQHDLEQMHEVLLAHTADNEALRKRLAKLEAADSEAPLESRAADAD